MNRRDFVKTASATAAGTLVLNQFAIGKEGGSANNKLNIAMIGCGNIAKMAFEGVPNENIVALCDVDQTFIDEARSLYPNAAKARSFTDFREMFDKMGNEIDGVCISTPDHTHYVSTMWAMENGSHVCTQKPLTRTIWEARTLQKAAKKTGVITNMANQGHTYDGIRKTREWIEAGVIGDVEVVHAWEAGPSWGNGWFEKPSEFPLLKEAIPETLNWDLWLGPLAERDYNHFYHPKTWRGFWDLGTGMLGDWFCHTCDGAVWALQLFEAEYVERISIGGENNEGHMIPDRSLIKWHFGPRNGMPACDLYWHDGAMKPSAPDNWTFGDIPYRGSFFYGDKNALFLDERSNNPKLTNRKDMIDFMRSGNVPPVKYPRNSKANKQPFAEWASSIKGDIGTPGSNFDYAAKLTEVALLGVLAQRFGGRIEWDAKNGKITNRPELNAFVKEPVRKGWEIGENYA